MAKLTSRRRKVLKLSQYGLPSKAKKGPKGGAPRGAFPIPDKAHAINAKARARQGFNKGTLSRTEMKKIFERADRVLRKSGAKMITTHDGRRVKI